MRIARTLLAILSLTAFAYADAAPKPEVFAARSSRSKKNEKVTRLGDLVIVSVSNDDEFRKQVGTNTITLFINGQDTKTEPIDRATSDYVFRLERNEKNKELWERLLEAPFTEPISDIHVSVGFNSTPLPDPNHAGVMKLKKVEFSWAAWIWIAILIFVLWYFFYLVRSTDILRNGPSAGGQEQPYSLARTQMAWWLFIVIVSFVTIWMITGNRDTVSDKTLILLGISSGTALGAVAIDATSSNRTKSALDRLNSEITTLNLQKVSADATDELKTAIDERIAAIQKEKTNIVKTQPSVSWWRDILTDDSGAIALNRLQVLLWTFVLGIVFMVSVVHVLSMPSFDNTLLALMGISSGTYLGFKFPTTG
jgi:hypothetical protein